ncbi:sporulation protein [Halosimplex aquaticum]|uniref:Sporulation protein n=1 Tax=Halosimplex aquaticum TaxID=3026162 RepID=A0ABD5YA99_9EURY|nr:sporulation protein [Halosimplex aquaticum]
MKKILASVGIGNATVDTVLHDQTVRPGESVDAVVQVEGGDAEQTVDRIELDVETRYRGEEGYEEATVDRFHLTDGFTVEPGESTSYETALSIPYATPLTMGDASVWVDTDLEVSMAVDPEDKDRLEVRPTERMQTVFDAAEDLGLSFRTADCEADPYGRYTDRRFVQEFEFRPSEGPFRGELDELELVFDPSPEALTVYAEVDRRGGLLSELADADERKTSFALPEADPDAARSQLEGTIDRLV